MDPNIMKLLEEDEDETMHSGADVEAFTAALNRDIEGHISTSQPSGPDTAALSQQSNHNSPQLLSQWQNSDHNEIINSQGPQDSKILQQQEQCSSDMELKQQGPSSENLQQPLQDSNYYLLQQKQPHNDGQQQQTEQKTPHISQAMGMPNLDKNSIQIHESEIAQQKLSNQPVMTSGSAISQLNRSKQVPFALLLPVIQPQLDKDRALQLQTLYMKLKKNEISKDEFVRHMRSLVGDQMLKMAVYKLQAQAARQSGPNRFGLQSQSSVQPQHMQLPSLGAKQLPDSPSFTRLHPKGFSMSADASQVSSSMQMQSGPSNLSVENNLQKSQEIEHQSDAHGMHINQMPSSSLSSANLERDQPFPIQGLSKQQQQHLHFSQASFSTYGGTGSNYHSYSGTSITSSAQSLKQQLPDSEIRQVPIHPNTGSSQLGATSQSTSVMSIPNFETQNSFGDLKRVPGGTLANLTCNSMLPQNINHWQPSNNKDQKNAALSPIAYVKQEPNDQANEQQQKSSLSSAQELSPFSHMQVEQGSANAGTLKDESLEMQSSKLGYSTSSSFLPSNSVTSALTTQLDSNSSHLGSQMPSTTSPAGPGTNTKTPPKKSSAGQKRPLEALSSSPPMSSKKPKVSGTFLDQSIEQLNDVTAVSGVNLREEEEQLFSGPKEESRISEASRRVVQEEEERLILQRLPLQKKLAEIMAKCGLKTISSDVERCLSLCVEERMRGLISDLIRLSKQRVDIEKQRHWTLVTSDVRQQITMLNRKAREEYEKKQAEGDKLQKHNEDGSIGIDSDKEKDEARAKSSKVNKDEDDKMRTTAANIAARAAVGGPDMLVKWKQMQQAQQKRPEVEVDGKSGSQSIKDVTCKPALTSMRNAKDNREADKRSNLAVVSTPGAVRKVGRNQVSVPQTRVARSISVKDVVAVLEREPQMSNSTMIYRLYDKMHAESEAG